MTGHASTSRVQPYLDDGDLQLYHGDALTILQGLPAGIAQTCVTSPPYWGLRDYGTGEWSGGDETCDHKRSMNRQDAGRSQVDGFNGSTKGGAGAAYFDQTCGKCGAQRVDSQLGLEATPTQYVENMVALFREVRRVLRDDGTLWLNLGDSYTAGMGSRNGLNGSGLKRNVTDEDERQRCLAENKVYRAEPVRGLSTGLKPKDLVGIPWRVAFALQADGWYLRSDIIWSKPNPMPESVTDRPTKAHEYLFLFSKQPRYFYDADAIREPHTAANLQAQHQPAKKTSENGQTRDSWVVTERYLNPAGRNRRSVWTIPTQPFPEAHFATYPEELVRPCILAGTSERGGCIECGAPWTRQLDYERTTPGMGGGNTVYRPGRPDGFYMPGGGFGGGKRDTIGWAPTCACDVRQLGAIADTAPGDADSESSTHQRGPGSFPYTRPQLVLDPFIGSGTTALVARKHGRRSLGIDLSTEYLAIAAKRTQQLSLLGGVA